MESRALISAERYVKTSTINFQVPSSLFRRFRSFAFLFLGIFEAFELLVLLLRLTGISLVNDRVDPRRRDAVTDCVATPCVGFTNDSASAVDNDHQDDEGMYLG
jgi:hypothetical protein